MTIYQLAIFQLRVIEPSIKAHLQFKYTIKFQACCPQKEKCGGFYALLGTYLQR
jgi:hypothetical protein